MGTPPGEQLSCIRVIAFSSAFFLEQFFLNYYFLFFFSSFFSHFNDVKVYFCFFMDIMIFFSTSYTSNVHIHKAEFPFKNKPVCEKSVTDAKYRSGSHSRTGLAAPVYSQ